MDYWFWYARNHNDKSNLQSTYTGSHCDNIDSIKMSLEDIKALFATHCLDDTIIMPLVSLYFLMRVLLFLSHLMNGVTTIHLILQENNNNSIVFNDCFITFLNCMCWISYTSMLELSINSYLQHLITYILNLSSIHEMSGTYLNILISLNIVTMFSTTYVKASLR